MNVIRHGGDLVRDRVRVRVGVRAKDAAARKVTWLWRAVPHQPLASRSDVRCSVRPVAGLTVE